MPTRIFDSSQITKRRAEKVIANSFLTRIDSPNNTSGSAPLLGISSNSIINTVKTGSMTQYTDCGASYQISIGCPCPTSTNLIINEPDSPMILKYNVGNDTEIVLPLTNIGENCGVIVDWGDGTEPESISEAGNKSHTYTTGGEKIVTISGILIEYGSVEVFQQPNLIEVISFGNTGLTSLAFAFYGASNLTTVPLQIPSTVTDMNSMFRDATAFNQNIGGWNVSNVTDMSNMFNGASAFNQNIGSWNVSNVLSMTNMFNGASAFNQNIGGWNVSNVLSMSDMFFNASAFNQNIGGWNVSNVVVMTNMFNGSALSTTNYDSLLIGWAALTSLQSNVTFSAGSTKYSNSALNARDTLEDPPNRWTIFDGGQVP